MSDDQELLSDISNWQRHKGHSEVYGDREAKVRKRRNEIPKKEKVYGKC